MDNQHAMEARPDVEALRLAAGELARTGGTLARRFLGKVRATRKPDNSPVTPADTAVQEAILAILAQRFPDHAILVEEEVADPSRHAQIARAEYCWVIDPIDGTRNFARGMPVYCTSVAVLHRGQPIAGAIHDATQDVVYSASRGGGTFRGNAPVRLADRPIDVDTTIAISSIRKSPIPTSVRSWLDQYLFRNIGSLCLHMVWVAAGLTDAAFSLESKIWDIAAGALQIEESGGVVTDHAGNSLWPADLANYRGDDVPMLAGTPTMHRRLLDSLR